MDSPEAPTSHEGMMGGKDMMSYLPLHLSAIEREATLLPWMLSWAGKDAEVLEPGDWFMKGYDIVGQPWARMASGDQRWSLVFTSGPHPPRPATWPWKNCAKHGSKGSCRFTFSFFLACSLRELLLVGRRVPFLSRELVRQLLYFGQQR
jgi:hypothetical protein